MLCFRSPAYRWLCFSLIIMSKGLQNLVHSSSRVTCRKFLGTLRGPCWFHSYSEGFAVVFHALLHTGALALYRSLNWQRAGTIFLMKPELRWLVLECSCQSNCLGPVLCLTEPCQGLKWLFLFERKGLRYIRSKALECGYFLSSWKKGWLNKVLTRIPGRTKAKPSKSKGQAQLWQLFCTVC